MLQQGSIFDNRYELIRLLGRGGFAEVWLVNDTLAGLKEALKIYAPGSGMDEDGLKVFAKELTVVHNLRHTNLLTPKTLGQCDNQPYLVLPYCPNGSLNKKVGNCTEEEAWKILEQVASGLAYLHQRNIIHQDIKPDNILTDENNDYVITDFGISMKAQSTLRKSMRIQANSGTMAYMAPERFSAEPHPIPANDVWSLGAMMFELLEGEVPFFAQMGGLAQKNGADLPTMHADVSDALKQLILSMLAKEADARPTAEQVAERAKKRQGGATPTEGRKTQPVIDRKPQPADERKTQLIENHNPQPVDDRKTQRIEPIPATPEKKELPKEEKSTNTNPQKRKKHIIGWSIAAAVLLVIGLIFGLGGSDVKSDESKESERAIVEENVPIPLEHILMEEHVLIDNLYYNLYADNTAEVVREGDKENYKDLQGEIIIPSSVQFNSTTYVVTSIGDEAFEYCAGLKSVALPSSVTSIGRYVFNESGITKPVYNQHVFAYMPRSYSGAYTILEGIEQIADHAFWECTDLTSVTIPSSVTSIGSYAFRDCPKLKSVTLPNSVTSIGARTFDESGITQPVYNQHIFAYMPDSYSGAYTIPDGIEQIADGAFTGCSLTSVTIPNSVTTIGEYVFNGSWWLKSVSLPNSVINIGLGAFSATGITKPVYNQHVFAYMPYSYSGAYTIPEGIEQIADGAFDSCSGLTSVTIPNSVTSIGDYAFIRCSGLKSATIPEHTKIGYKAFEECEQVQITRY